jgi:hypothetical protein
LAGRRARAGSQEEGKGRVTAYCKRGLHLRSACTIFAAKSGLWPEKKQIAPSSRGSK